jgi:TolB-like protein/predicted Ser/Thr protein kinase
VSLETGQRLAGYEILGPLGAGGMGEVYRAKDVRLGREVALKVLPEDIAADAERRSRFEREARAASALNHPNIVTIHGMDVHGGLTFIVMELVEGRTLRDMLRPGPLPSPTFLAIATQLADGLARAHDAGIVHRDLKPENVMVTPEGRVKILDFGLAKLTPVISGPPAQMETAALSTGSTEPGVIMGTLGYMSPEQATGRTVDHRSDQFAVGAILYEMATGRRAFVRSTAVESLAAILRDEPEPIARVNPEVAPGLDRLVARCLAKDPASRHASTRDLARELAALPAIRPRATRPALFALAALGAAVLAALVALAVQRRSADPAPGARAMAPAAPVLAVLPLQLVGGDPADEYFADGITESITTDVAKIPGLLVIARDTAFRYKGQAVEATRVGQDLGAGYLLQGSVQRAEGRLRVNAQLVDTKTGHPVWADRFDREMKDVFQVQDEICDHIVSSLQLALAERAGRRAPTSSLEAHDAYLRGLSFAERFAWSEKDKAIPLLEQAVALDPQFAIAHAALAAQYARKSFARDPKREWESKAFVQLEKALAIDPGLSGPYVTRGNLVFTQANGFHFERAAADYREALKIEPSSADARAALASLLLHAGLLDRAREEYSLALRAAPGDPGILFRLARIHLYRAEYGEALTELRRSGELARNWQTVLALQGLKRNEEAERLVQDLRAEQAPRETEDMAASYAVVLAATGRAREAETEIAAAIRHGEGSSHFHHAMHGIGAAYALMGRKAEAMHWLRRAAAEGLPCYPMYAKDPNLDGLRGDPAFQAFLAERKAQWERFQKEL